MGGERAIEAIEGAAGTWRVQGAWRPNDGPGKFPWGGIDTPWELYGRLKRTFDPALVLGPPVFGSVAPGAGRAEGGRS